MRSLILLCMSATLMTALEESIAAGTLSQLPSDVTSGMVWVNASASTNQGAVAVALTRFKRVA